jgi:hypothetical protein
MCALLHMRQLFPAVAVSNVLQTWHACMMPKQPHIAIIITVTYSVDSHCCYNEPAIMYDTTILPVTYYPADDLAFITAPAAGKQAEPASMMRMNAGTSTGCQPGGLSAQTTVLSKTQRHGLQQQLSSMGCRRCNSSACL